MKKCTMRLIALLLALSLTACSVPQTTLPEEPPKKPEETADLPAPDDTPVPDLDPEVHLLAEACLPQLPEEPSEMALMEADSAIYASNNLSDQEKMDASQKLWDDYMEQSRAYRSAVQAFKADTPTADQLARLHAFTTQISGPLLTEDSDRNTVCSPANLWLALAMLAETAAGETQQEILDLLGVSEPETLSAVASSLWKQLYEDSSVQTTLLANSIWTDGDMTYHQETLDTLADAYYADAWQVPMGTDSANQALRNWLNEKTGGLLKDSVDGIETTPETILMLVSALYFKSSWQDEFRPEQNTEDPFTMADGSETAAVFMHQTRHQNVWQQDGYTMASLRFDGSASMRFLLPDEGIALDDLLENPEVLSFFTGDPGEGTLAEVRWSIPKFDITANTDLTDALKELGIIRAFQPDSANFTPLTDEPMVYVSAAEHAARVRIDEEGCEAAAYTVLAEAAAAEFDPPPVVELNLNRPFLFVITGIDGMPLFLGAVRNPTQ